MEESGWAKSLRSFTVGAKRAAERTTHTVLQKVRKCCPCEASSFECILTLRSELLTIGLFTANVCCDEGGFEKWTC